MELSQLLRTLRREWVTLVGIFVVVMATTLIQARLPTTSYASTTTLLVSPKTESGYSAGIQIVGFVVPAIEAQVGGATLRSRVEDASPAIADASYGVGVSSRPGTGVLNLTANSSDASLVSDIAASYARQLIDLQPKDSPIAISVLEPASPPVATTVSQLRLLVGGAVLALTLAVIGALLRHRLRRRRSLADDLFDEVGLPVLGSIPKLNSVLSGDASPGQLYSRNEAVGAEAIVAMATNIDLAMASRDALSVSVVSARSGDGRTNVAMHLAWRLAAAGRSVWLVEADLRRPRLSDLLGTTAFGRNTTMHGEPGAWLALASTARPGMMFVSEAALRGMGPAAPQFGADDRHPVDIVSVAVPALLDYSGRAKEVVVFDLPPLAGAAETLLVAAKSDVVVLVADARSGTMLEDVSAAAESLRLAGCEVIGLVLNRTRTGRHRRSARPFEARARPAAAVESSTGRDIFAKRSGL
ncbi:MAG: hypothetical protein ABIM89_16515 [Mycobacteriales bacterium]